MTYVLGSRKSLQKSTMLYVSWISDMITSSTSLSVLLLFLTSFLSGADLLVEWILLATFVSLRTAVFMYHACKSEMVLVGLSYPLYKALIKPIIDIFVLCFAIATWSIQIWGK